jgi:hypothetical protein
MSQTTRSGVAVTVTLSPGTSAVASNVRQLPSSTHNQVGNPTSCAAPTGGDVCTTGATNGTRSYASTAMSSGAGAGAAAPGAL